jgi:hypothetical protein
MAPLKQVDDLARREAECKLAMAFSSSDDRNNQ